MPTLRELQQQFSGYLLKNKEAITEYIIEDDKLDKKSRLDIYKNAYEIRLQKSIETDLPVLSTYLGDELFDQLASGYIAQHPSRYSSLRHFCDDIPDYLATTAPFDTVPILTEIARFERAMTDTFDTADAERATLENLQTIPAEKWPYITLGFHPSVNVFKADWNSVESWQALKNEQIPPAASPVEDRHWLLWRSPDRLTQFRSLQPDESIMLQGFLLNTNFAEICEILMHHLPEDEIGTRTVKYLHDWLANGIVSQINYQSSCR